MIHDVEHETMPREDLEALQLKRLQAVVERVYHLVPFYRRRMDELGVKPEHIRTLADLQPAAFHRQAGPAGQLPLRHVRRPHGPDRADSRLVRHHRQTHPRGLYPAGPGDLVRADGPDPGRRPAPTGAISSTSLTATACSPAAWGSITAPSAWGPRSSRCPAARPAARSCSSRTSAPPSSAAPRPSPCTWRRWARKWGWTSPRPSSGWGSSGPNPGPKACARRSKSASASTPWTFTACPRSSARA